MNLNIVSAITGRLECFLLSISLDVVHSPKRWKWTTSSVSKPQSVLNAGVVGG